MATRKVTPKPNEEEAKSAEATPTTEARDSAPITIGAPSDTGIHTPAPDLRPPEEK